MCPTRHGERVPAAMEGGSVHTRTTKFQAIKILFQLLQKTIQLNNKMNQRKMKCRGGSIPTTVSPWLKQKTRPSPGSDPLTLAEAQVEPGRNLGYNRPKLEYRETDIGNGPSQSQRRTFSEIGPATRPKPRLK